MIDQEHLARQTAGDTDLQLELLSLFLLQLREMRNLLDERRVSPAPAVADLAGLLHRIRGAAAAVGAEALNRSFGRAEEVLEANRWFHMAENELRTEVDAACATLARLIAAQETAGLAKGGESR